MSKQSNITGKLAVNSSEKKPSVFERLGSKSCVVSGKNVCRSWAQNGTCSLNKSCKFAHTHVLFSTSKRSKAETMKKSVIIHKKSKDEHKKSLRSHQSSEREWEGWELGDLEDADEKVLEKRKQELQRELQLQLKKEKELTRKKDKKIEKKRAASTSSSSSTTSESSTSSTSSSTSSSEPRKRLSRKRKHASSSSDSEVSPQRRKKSPKTVKGKVTTVKKTVERKTSKVVSESKGKSAVSKKAGVQKKSYSPSWEKSKGRSPVKQQPSKKLSPHSPNSKNKSSSPRYDKGVIKSKSRGFSPKQKGKEASPKRTMRKVKESSVHLKDKPRQSPSKTSKVSPGRSRRHEESSEKHRSHHDEKKHSPRRDRSREKDRKRDVRRGRSHDDDNGGLKKGGKILPLKPSSYNKDNVAKKDPVHHKSSEKSSDLKSKDDDNDKDRNRVERSRDRNEKEKSKCERERSKHKKGNDDHDRRSVRDRDSDRNMGRRDDRCRDREAERLRFAKEREAERQKEREEALERCRERQRERERLEKEKKEKEDKKHQRDKTDNESKEFERELPSLLDLKAENPRNHLDSVGSKSSDKHLLRDTRRNVDKDGDKSANQSREGRDHGTPDKGHDRRDLRRSVENERRLLDKEYESRRNREGDIRNSSEVRRSVGDGRRGTDDGDARRPWDDVRRVMDPLHGRRSLDPSNDRRQQALTRRSGDDHYRRGRDGDLDLRDYPVDERQRRKPLHNHSDWNPNDQNLDYRDADIRDDWSHPDRHLDWNSRYDHKWRDLEESREGGWNQYPRRPPLDEWNGDWAQDRPIYPEDRLEMIKEDFIEKRRNEPESVRPPEPNKAKETTTNSKEETGSDRDKPQKEGDALSDISDDPDDILNQEDEPVQEETSQPSNAKSDINQQIYVRSNEFLFEQRRPLLECLGERSLDFEEISDEELEEEARVSKGIVDVLGADWAGLVQETRLKPKRFEGPGSAHRRWLMDKILFRYGISYKYAGQKFADKLVQKYKKIEVKAEKSIHKIENEDVKVEIEDVKPDLKTEEFEKENHVLNGTEEMDTTKAEIDEGILHPVPSLHSATREVRNMKANLFQSYNRFKRALSARTDLNLRRELCNLPSKEPLHFTSPLENKLYKTSVQLFRGELPTAAV